MSGEPTTAQEVAELTSPEREAIRSYLLSLIVLPAVTISIISFVLGFLVDRVARGEAYRDAYKDAFTASSKTIIDTATQISQAKANADQTLQQITDASALSKTTAAEIDKSKQAVDQILGQNIEKIARTIATTETLKSSIVRVNQDELIALRTEIESLKRSLNLEFGRLTSDIVNSGAVISNPDPRNDGGGFSPDSGPGRCPRGTFVVGIQPFKFADGTRRINFQCGVLPKIELR
jgi:hypothetical protein